MSYCAVDLGCLVRLSDALGTQSLADVLHSTLFAQLAADATANRAADPGAWLSAYEWGLSKLHWTLQHRTTNTIAVAERPMLVGDAIVIELGTDAGVADTLISFRLLASNDDRVTRFNGEVTDGQGACHLQVLSATLSDENPEMRLIDVAYRAKEAVTDPLIEAVLPGKDIMLRTTTLSATLDEEAYAAIRDSVDAKLGDRVDTDIGWIIGPLEASLA